MTRYAIFAAILSSALSVNNAFAVCDVKGPFEVDSKKAYSGASTKGASANNAGCFDAPSDGYIVEGTINSALGSNGGKANRCELFGVKSTIQSVIVNGNPIKFPAISHFCINAHAETGSGVGNKYKTAWTTCHVKYEECETQ